MSPLIVTRTLHIPSVAVELASAEPYASYLHFAPEDSHISQIFKMPFLTPNQQRQSTEGLKALKAYKAVDKISVDIDQCCTVHLRLLILF